MTCTISSEQKAFLRRLGTEPLFLLGHLPALGSVVARKIRTRILLALSGPHRGRKIWPQWLEPPGLGPQGLGAKGQERALHRAVSPPAHLPTYPWRFREQAHERMELWGTPSSPDEDHEDYLARHRWGFLLEQMLGDCVDWGACLEACSRWAMTMSDTKSPAWEPYSACERIANLAVFLAAMPPRMREHGIPPEMIEFMQRSVTWVYGHLEYYGPKQTNNHILNNARALVLGGIVGGDPTAVSAGMQIFRRCLPQMIQSGGFLRERSSHYQLVVLNWVLDAWRFVAAAEGPDAGDTRFLSGYAERMRAAASMLCERGTSLLAVIGDVSPDITPSRASARLALLYSDCWPHACPSEGLAIADGWFRLSKGDEMVLGNFPDGPFPHDFPTHGHGDYTSFIWSHAGQQILVDPGRHRYSADETSALQLSAVSHNLPTVNGLAPLCESIVQRGGWWPVPYASAQLKTTGLTDAIVMEHDGFARATPVSRHSRQIELRECGLSVVDSFQGSGPVDLSFYWHFGDAFGNFDRSRMLATGSGGNVRVDVGETTGKRDGIELHAELLPGGISAEYGRISSSVRLRLSCSARLPVTISTQFSWVAGAA